MRFHQISDNEQFPPTIVIRHKKENLKKCSLRGLENRSDFLFYRYPLQALPALENYLLLSLESEVDLSIDDRDSGLLLLDATWKYAQEMGKKIDFPATLQKRRLPGELITSYPRRQQDCLDPQHGLASLEAIAASYAILGRSIEGLLDHYYWKDSFIEKNKGFLINCQHANKC